MSGVQPPFETKRAAFVVGYMHSGTTLLRNILAQSRVLFAPPGETRFFEEQPYLRSRFSDLRDEETLRQFVAELLPRTGAVLDADDAHAAVRSVLEKDGGMLHARAVLTLLDLAAESASAKGWLEKTPAHVFHLDAIFRARTDVRVIEIVRDVRDVLASKKTRRETVWSTERYTRAQRREKHLEKAYDPLWDTLSWKAAIQAGEHARKVHAGRVLRVHYEDLISRPTEEVQLICAFLDVPFEASMLDVSAGNAAVWTKERLVGGVRSSSRGRWKTVLNPAEVALSQWAAGDVMVALGYGAEPVAMIQQAQMPLLLLRSLVDLFRRFYRRLRWRGAGYAWMLINSYVQRLGVLRSTR